jgi:O-antigen ligase
MGVNMLVALFGRNAQERRPSADFWWVHYLFYMIVLVNLFRLAVDPSFPVAQRLFIYFLGFLTFFQFSSRRSLEHFFTLQSLTGFVVAVWVIITAKIGGYIYRGGIEVNPNYVATFISLGIIPVYLRQVMRIKEGKLRSVWSVVFLAMFSAGMYAMLLLASRGVTAALLVSLIIMTAMTVSRARHVASISILGGLVSYVMLSLPGSKNLSARFTEANIQTFNDRLPLWQAAWDKIIDASPLQLSLGYGFGYGEGVASSASLYTTSLHNVYLQMTVEFGLAGLLLFLCLHIFSLKGAFGLKNEYAIYRIGLVTFLLVSSLSATAADNFIYWIILGYVFAIKKWNT